MWYVTMTDKFMSNWGEAKGKRSIFVVVCDTYDEALTVMINALNRTDMSNVHVRSSRPSYNPETHHVKFHTKSDGMRFYTPNAFKKESA